MKRTYDFNFEYVLTSIQPICYFFHANYWCKDLSLTIILVNLLTFPLLKMYLNTVCRLETLRYVDYNLFPVITHLTVLLFNS